MRYLNENYKNYFKQRLVESLLNEAAAPGGGGGGGGGGRGRQWWQLFGNNDNPPSRRPARFIQPEGSALDLERGDRPFRFDDFSEREQAFLRKYLPREILSSGATVNSLRGGFVVKDRDGNRWFFKTNESGYVDPFTVPVQLPKGLVIVPGMILLGYDEQGYPIFGTPGGETVFSNPSYTPPAPSTQPNDVAPQMPGGSHPLSPTLVRPDL